MCFYMDKFYLSNPSCTLVSHTESLDHTINIIMLARASRDRCVVGDETGRACRHLIGQYCFVKQNKNAER